MGQANGGKFTVRNKETEFVTRWSSCGADAVYAYKDNVEMVGYKAGQRQIPYSKDDFETFHPKNSRVDSAREVIL